MAPSLKLAPPLTPRPYLRGRVADPHHFNADPDPALYFNPNPNPAFHFNADPEPVVQLLFKVMGICDHWSIVHGFG
jgi:hypothetical protein